jgi:crossover junction endodeoxyribonuclease RuvC
MIYSIGIDPGKSGAMALLGNGAYREVRDWDGGPTMAQALSLWLDLYPVALVGLERVHSMPKQGVRSTFSFGENFGWWQGALDAFRAPWRAVTPQAWMKGLVPPKRGPTDKPGLLVAERLFPDAPLAGPRGGAKDGRADALLIGYWAFQEISPPGERKGG